MMRTAKAIASGFGWAIGVGVTALALAQPPAVSPDVPTFVLCGNDFRWRQVGRWSLIREEPIQQELKLTDAQKKDHAAIIERHSQRLQQRSNDFNDFRRALAGVRADSKGIRGGDPREAESGAARTCGPDPAPGSRPDRLRTDRRRRGAFTEPNLPGQLKMSDDQVRARGRSSRRGHR